MRLSGLVWVLPAVVLCGGIGVAAERGKKRGDVMTTNAYIESLQSAPSGERERAAGSLYDDGGRLADLGRDLRASQLGDTITVIVSDRASAVSRGTSKSSRQSSAKASISALGGPTPVAGPLGALANLSGQQQLDGQGETSRVSELQTTVTARVVHVLPNGSMVVEGSKLIAINSERQRVLLRGVLRWNDISKGNQVSSDRLANLEVTVEGKGLVGDAVRRPGLLYRLLLGVLPF